MKRLVFILTAFLFSSINLIPSTILKGTIYDETGNPVSFAKVVIQNTSKGTLSDRNGNYQLEYDTIAGDSLIIKMPGFERKAIYIGEEIGDIVLTSIVYDTEEINVKPSNYVTRYIGFFDTDTRAEMGFASQKEGTEIGIKIEKDQLYQVLGAKFKVNYNSLDSFKLRVNVYDINDDELGKNILNESITFQYPKRKNFMYYLDLSKYKIYHRGDAMVSIEMIETD